MPYLTRCLVFIGLLAAASPVVAQEYECSGEGDVTPGVCLPKQGEIIFAENVRAALYVRCAVSPEGRDEYVADCCEHLIEDDQYIMGVCKGRSIPAKGVGQMLSKGEIGSGNDVLCERIDCAAFESYLEP